MPVDNAVPHPNKVTIFLMTEKGFHFLTSTAGRYRPIFDLIVVGSDKSLQKDYEDDIIQFCEAASIPFVRKADFGNIRSEYAMSIAWRWLIDHPADKLIVFHDSLLPTYRGFAPLVNAMINGEPEVGVSAVFGAAEFDTGDIIAQARTSLSYPIKIQDAITRVNQCYLEAASVVLQRILENAPMVATPQENQLATYSVWRDELDYQIDWTQSSRDIRRLIDAVGHPYKGAYTKLDHDIVRISDAVEVDDVVVENRHAGKVLFVNQGKPIVICEIGRAHV